MKAQHEKKADNLGEACFTYKHNIGCNKTKNEECISYTTAQVISVAAPDTASVNQETAVIILYRFFNGCERFQRIDTISSGDTTIISLAAKYEGCACTAIITGGKTIYNFKASQTGKYYFKFLQPDKTFLTDTITVK